jgi:hypothetical protein
MRDVLCKRGCHGFILCLVMTEAARGFDQLVIDGNVRGHLP